MEDKFQNKYRIKSARMPNWDYGWSAYYYVTICTQGRVCCFGEVIDGKMVLSDVGTIADNFMLEIPMQFSYAKIDEYVIMPDHLHMNVRIEEESVLNRDAINRDSDIKPKGGITEHKNPMLHDNLSRVIRWYKGHVTFEIRKIYSHFYWQPRFHCHIIRDEQSLFNVRQYIKKNPENW